MQHDMGISAGANHSTFGSRDRKILVHLLGLRRADGWPVIGADQFIEDPVDGALADDLDSDHIHSFLEGSPIANGPMLLLGGRIDFAYRMVVGAIPCCRSIAWPSLIRDHPDWLWALPGKHWAHPDVTVYSNGKHYCGPPLRLEYARMGSGVPRSLLFV